MNEAVLSARTLPEPTVERLRNALVVPMQPGHDLACGVFRTDGTFCELSRTLYSASRFTGRPQRPDTAAHLAGTYLYAGIGRHHFGHFLLECIPRLWALTAEPAIDGILIVPKAGIDFSAVMRRRLQGFVDLLSGGLPIHLIEAPVQVDDLVVPSQGIGHQNWVEGTAVFREFAKERLAQLITPEGPEKLYVSRSQLKRGYQKVDQEERIERLMNKAGYTVFHPQKHKIAEQCQHYMAARVIVGGDGSAFHLAPLVMRPGTRVGLIQRRWRQAAFDALARQITAFADIDLTTINPLRSRGEGKRAKEDDPSPLSFRALKRELEENGFL